MVEGDTKVVKKYFDEETGQTIDINMTVRDHVLFRLLQKLEGAIRRIK